MIDISHQELRETPLTNLQRELGGRMVPFAGTLMPVQFKAGIIAEHLHCRTQAALFDVSHMGQARIDSVRAKAILETLVPGDIIGLKLGQMRYTMFTNARGGIEDDLMVANVGNHLYLVVNAANKEADFARLATVFGDGCTVLEDSALLALQGPAAAAVMARLAPQAAALSFMTACAATVAGIDCFVCRSGYTGEDGFEISVAAIDAVPLAKRLLEQPEVALAGLGARDSLRLEAGLCLHGNDITADITPIEAGLAWTVGRRRRIEGGFPGANIILSQLDAGSTRVRVGLVLAGRVPARAHAVITDRTGQPVGEVTSGGFAPSLNQPVAMGIVARTHAKIGTILHVIIRDVAHDVVVTRLPFVDHRYHKG